MCLVVFLKVMNVKRSKSFKIYKVEGYNCVARIKYIFHPSEYGITSYWAFYFHFQIIIIFFSWSVFAFSQHITQDPKHLWICVLFQS